MPSPRSSETLPARAHVGEPPSINLSPATFVGPAITGAIGYMVGSHFGRAAGVALGVGGAAIWFLPSMRG